MPKNLSDLPSMSSTTSAATPTAWRSPMIEFSRPTAEKSPSVTGTEKNKDRKKTMTLNAHEFIRRFLLHVIPKGFVRVRHFGFLTNRSKSLLSKCRQLLALNPALPKLPAKSVHELMLQLTGIDITRNPLCRKGTLVFLSNLPSPYRGILRDDQSTNKRPCLCIARCQTPPIGSTCFITSRLAMALRYPAAANRCIKHCPVFS